MLATHSLKNMTNTLRNRLVKFNKSSNQLSFLSELEEKMDFSHLDRLSDNSIKNTNSMIQSEETITKSSLFTHSNNIYYIDSFTDSSYAANKSQEIQTILSSETQNHKFWDIYIDQNKLKQLALENKSQIPRALNLKDLLENGVISTSPNTSSNPIFAKNKVSKSVWKKDKVNQSQYSSGLVGIDWTNPLFEG